MAIPSRAFCILVLIFLSHGLIDAKDDSLLDDVDEDDDNTSKKYSSSIFPSQNNRRADKMRYDIDKPSPEMNALFNIQYDAYNNLIGVKGSHEGVANFKVCKGRRVVPDGGTGNSRVYKSFTCPESLDSLSKDLCCMDEKDEGFCCTLEEQWQLSITRREELDEHISKYIIPVLLVIWIAMFLAVMLHIRTRINRRRLNTMFLRQTPPDTYLNATPSTQQPVLPSAPLMHENAMPYPSVNTGSVYKPDEKSVPDNPDTLPPSYEAVMRAV